MNGIKYAFEKRTLETEAKGFGATKRFKTEDNIREEGFGYL